MFLYHFTDWRNLESIEEHGLLSWPILFSMGIRHFPGSNSLSRTLDKKKKVQNYVHLCTRKYHPMLGRCLNDGRIQRVAWLIIDPAVIRWGATLFSDENATSDSAEIGSDPSIALDSFSDQAEVMVSGSLSSRWIRFP